MVQLETHHQEINETIKKAIENSDNLNLYDNFLKLQKCVTHFLKYLSKFKYDNND
jgi:hypothetical protein